MSDWRPIGTAPKTGEWLLVWYDDGNGVSMASCLAGLWQDWDGDLYGPPTHWMPLPEGPENDGYPKSIEQWDKDLQEE